MGKTTRKTNEEYRQLLFNKQPDVEVIDSYVNMDTKINHRCKIHNMIYLQRPAKALAGQCGCNDCLNEKMKKITLSHRKTNEQYIQDVRNVWGDEIIVLEEYTTSNSKIRFLHNTETPHEFVSEANSILRGEGCGVCRGLQVCVGYNDIASTNKYIASLFSNKEDTYKYTQGSKSRVDFICDCCGKNAVGFAVGVLAAAVYRQNAAVQSPV